MHISRKVQADCKRSKQATNILDADPKAMQQIHLIWNLQHAENTTMFFVNEKVKETVLDFSQGTVKVL